MPEKKAPKLKYYYSKSARHTLPGLIPERRFDDGRRRGDVAVRFDNHFKITNEPKVQKHIENSTPFAIGFIKEVSRERYEELVTKLARAKRTGQPVEV